MFIFHNVTITVPENFTQCTTRGSFVQHWQETLYNMFTFACLFLLPLVIMIFCYARILVEISSRMGRGNLVSREVPLRRSHNNIPKARMRTLKMSIVIVTSFIVCWTPYYLLGLWYWLFPEEMEETVSHSLTHMLFIFGLFNACLDPITYGLFTIHFHHGLRRFYLNAAARTTSSDNNRFVSKTTVCSAALHMRRLPAHRQAADGGQRGLQREKGCHSASSSYLSVSNGSRDDDPKGISPISKV
ncbi:unnamed protein product [Merluccius merluccius]